MKRQWLSHNTVHGTTRSAATQMQATWKGQRYLQDIVSFSRQSGDGHDLAVPVLPST